jgi:uncharacterized protein YuzE
LGGSARTGWQVSARRDTGGQNYYSQRVSRPAIQTMKLTYYRDTDSLYIDLSTKPSVETREVSEGVQLDYDDQGNLVGIDIDNASRKLDLSELITSDMPVTAS